jgi:hypothetical protein
MRPEGNMKVIVTGADVDMQEMLRPRLLERVPTCGA